MSVPIHIGQCSHTAQEKHDNIAFVLLNHPNQFIFFHTVLVVFLTSECHSTQAKNYSGFVKTSQFPIGHAWKVFDEILNHQTGDSKIGDFPFPQVEAVAPDSVFGLENVTHR